MCESCPETGSDLLQTFSQLAPALEILLSQLTQPFSRKGALYSSNVPVLRLNKIETPIREKKRNETEKKEEKEHTLKTITPHLDNVS